jgi:hypothetical protein
MLDGHVMQSFNMIVNQRTHTKSKAEHQSVAGRLQARAEACAGLPVRSTVRGFSQVGQPAPLAVSASPPAPATNSLKHARQKLCLQAVTWGETDRRVGGQKLKGGGQKIKGGGQKMKYPFATISNFFEPDPGI